MVCDRKLVYAKCPDFDNFGEECGVGARFHEGFFGLKTTTFGKSKSPTFKINRG